jgi:hypothetical protein
MSPDRFVSARFDYPTSYTAESDRQLFAQSAESFHMDAMSSSDRRALWEVLHTAYAPVDRWVLAGIVDNAKRETERKVAPIGLTRAEYYQVFDAYLVGDTVFLEAIGKQSWEYIHHQPQLVATRELYRDGDSFTSSRLKLHRDIRDTLFRGIHAPKKPRYTLLAGNLGTGKSVLTQNGDVSSEGCVIFDPDAIRDRLLEESVYGNDSNDQLRINAVREELHIVLDAIFFEAYERRFSIYSESSLRRVTPWWDWVFQTLPESGYEMSLVYAIRGPSDCLRRMVTMRNRVSPISELSEGIGGGIHFYNIVMSLQKRAVPHSVTIFDFSEVVLRKSAVRCVTAESVRTLLTESIRERHPNDLHIYYRADDIPIER